MRQRCHAPQAQSSAHRRSHQHTGAVISTPAQSSAHRRGHQRTGAVISIAK